MTFLASRIYVRSCQREIRQVVVKDYVFPIVGGMTGGAVGAKFSVVLIILLVA